MHVYFRNPYSESIKEMLKTFGTATYKVGLKVHPNEEDRSIPVSCLRLLLEPVPVLVSMGRK